MDNPFTPEEKMNQRYFANLIWSWCPVAEDADGLLKEYVQRCKDIGFDTIRIDIPWDKTEPAKGSFDFSWADKRLRYLSREADMNLVVILNSRDHPDWLGTDRLLMKWADGSVFRRPMGQRAYGILSLNSDEVRDATASFYAATVGHIQKEYGDNVVAYSSAWTPEMESEYFHGTKATFSPDDDPMKCWYLDHSDFAKAEYREWLAEHGTMREEIPKPEDGDEKFARWCAFREWTLKRMFDTLSAAVTGAGAAGKYKVQFGSVWDKMSGRRGSLGFGYSPQPAGWLVVDDSYHYDHCFSADVLWGTVPDKLKANEVGGPPKVREELVCFARETYQHGVNMFQFANWCGREGVQWLNEFEPEIREIARLRDEAETLPRREDPMTVSVRDLYLSRCDQSAVDKIIKQYRAGSQNGTLIWPVTFQFDLRV